jgi:hypothetical protein
MKIRITFSQLKKVLQSEKLKYPIKLKGATFTNKEYLELAELLQAKQRG